MSILKGILRLTAWLCAAGLLAVAAGAIAIVVYIVPELPPTELLKDVRFQVPLRVYSQDEKLMAEFGEKRRVPLRLEQVPNLMIKAIISSEDERFYEHPGVDWRGLARAVLHIVRTGHKGPGGSTITMQVARNFFLGREKTYRRKLNEILLSLKIERELSKDEILELYVNKIFLGHRAYGIGAAASVYYGKGVEELTLSQMAMIAGLPQRPSEYNPIANPRQAIVRRNYVLGRMVAAGHIDGKALAAAAAEPISATLHRPIVELDSRYVAEMVRAYVEDWAGDKAYTDGYSVYTTIDSRLQKAATGAIRNGLRAYDRRHGYRGSELNVTLAANATRVDFEALLKDFPPVGGLRAALILEVTPTDAKAYVRGHGEVILPWESISWARKHISESRRGPKLETASQALRVGDVVRVVLGEAKDEEQWALAQVPKIEGALVAVRPNDGAMVALVGGFDFFRSKFNRATQAERQPGSNFKPFIYSAALEKGFTAASLINDAPVVFDDPSLESAWRPENYSGKFFGPTRLRFALTKSRNLVSIRLLRRMGIDYALQHIERFGFDSGRLPRNLSLSLGSGGLTALEVATGYAILANGGYAIKPYFVQRIADSRGETLYEANPPVVCRECELPTDPEAPNSPQVAPRAVSEQNIWIVNSILRDVITRGTGRRALALKRKDLAGKTGTTNDLHDAWFSGFVPSLVATTWIGFDQLAPLGRGETGSRAALPMWMEFMAQALEGVPEETLTRPDGLVTVRIDPDTGELADATQKNAIFETFRAAYVPTETAISSAAANHPGAPLAQDARTRAKGEGATKRLF